MLGRTRAYRMKLKEWGLMRNKTRQTRIIEETLDGDLRVPIGGDSRSMPATTDRRSTFSEHLNQGSETTGSQVATSNTPTHAQASPIEAIDRNSKYVLAYIAIRKRVELIYSSLQPSVDVLTWIQDVAIAPDATYDMLECILDNDSEKLEKLLMKEGNHVNHPLGLPFERPSGRFASHPAVDQMVLLQHPRQTLLDVASAMPSGPAGWVLISYGARGSIHPLGADVAFHNAIRNGRNYTVQALSIPGRSDVNGLPDQLWKPLLHAVCWTGPEIVGVLLRRGVRVNDVGTSPTGTGTQTALQICLERRYREYHNESIRSRCNDILKLLLKAGADIHVASSEVSAESAFEEFIKPWQSYDYWSMKLSSAEMDCLGFFVEQGANLSTKFLGCPCTADTSTSFVHQVLFHSSPRVSRQVVSNYRQDFPTSGTLMLHQVIEGCPDTKRHCAEALEDIEILLGRGVDPNVLDSQGMAPLRKCVERSSTTDVLALTQKLLDGGADPEFGGTDEIQPYAVAALTLAEPTRTDVLQAMLVRMQGHQSKTAEDGRTYRWEAGLFPIPKKPNYQQVLSCTKPDGDFRLSMHEMVQIGAHQSFQRAYLAIISSRLIGDIGKGASSYQVSEQDRWNIMLTLSLRKGANLPNYQFDQSLVIALLGFPKVDILKLKATDDTTASRSVETTIEDHTLTTEPSLASTNREMPAFQPFRLNTNGSSTPNQFPTPSSASRRQSASNDDFVGDTTQIRWRNPESSRAPKSTKTFVLQHKCPVCADDRLLTKTELQKHEVEHAHAVECDGVGCSRRFCDESRKRKRTEGDA